MKVNVIMGPNHKETERRLFQYLRKVLRSKITKNEGSHHEKLT